MSSAVKLSSSIVDDAKIVAKVLSRSVAGQIEHWARIGRIAEDNPDLTYEMIKSILIAQEEAQAGQLTAYILKTKKK